MGIYDRDYYKEDEPRGLSLGGRRSMVTNIIIANFVVFVIDNLLTGEVRSQFSGEVVAHELGELLSLDTNLFTHPWNFWTLLTYGFSHAALETNTSIFHIGMNMYALWLFGRDVEGVYGRIEFLRVYLALIVLSGLVWLLIHVGTSGGQPGSLVGASGGVAGIVILFVLHFPKRTFYMLFLPGIPIPAWVLGVLMVAFDAIGAIGMRSGNVAFTAHLAGAGFALLYQRSRWSFGRVLPSKFSLPSMPKRRKPNLKLHDPEDYYKDLDEQADRLLEKVAREGQSSLTAAEQRTLEDYSRRMRQKHR